jgi:hypothetical protein
MTSLTRSGPDLKRAFGRLVRLPFAGMLVVQTVGVAFAFEDRSVAPEPIVAN